MLLAEEAERQEILMKGVLINSSLLVISALFSLALLEVGVRVLGQDRFQVERPNPERAVFWHYDDLLGWKHLPTEEGRFSLADVDVEVTINGQGLRDRSYSYQPPEGVFRIVVLGDSFVWGFGVEQDEIFTEIMEQSQNNLEVINLGISGYSTDQEYLLLKQEGLKYNPQLILLMVFENDVADNTLSVNYHIYPKPRFSIVNGELVLTHRPSPKVSLFRRAHYFLRTHLVAYNHLTRVLAYNSAPPIKRARDMIADIGLWLSGRENQDPYRLLFAILDEMKALAEAHDAQLVIVEIATHKMALDFDNTRPDELAEYCRRRGLPFLDLAGPFQEHLESNDDESLQLTHDPHWNAHGHALAARIISSYLQQEGLIPAK
jgi:lysophospholipase L1-like esterase